MADRSASTSRAKGSYQGGAADPSDQAIADPAWRASYLGRVPDNLRAREPADALGVPGYPSSGS